MNDKQMEKFIGYALFAIVASYIVQAMIPFLIWCMVGMVAWRVYLSYNKYK